MIHDGGMGHDRFEAAMFWVGALLAFLPVFVISGVLLWVRWQKRRGAAPQTNDPARAEVAGPDRQRPTGR